MVRLAAHAGAKAFLAISACPLRPCVQDKLDAWDPSRADDVQYLMNMAKKYVILDTLVANGGKCTHRSLALHGYAGSLRAAVALRRPGCRHQEPEEVQGRRLRGPCAEAVLEPLTLTLSLTPCAEALEPLSSAHSRSSLLLSGARTAQPPQPPQPMPCPTRRDVAYADEQGCGGRAGRQRL
eukprot:scaffold27781_cov61-Phaeocystis_antarctica.AAC.2